VLKKQYHDDGGGGGDLTDEQWKTATAATKAWTGQPAKHRRDCGIPYCIVRVPQPRDIPAERYAIIELFPVGSIGGEKQDWQRILLA